MAYNLEPKTVDDYKALKDYVGKYPDKLVIVNTIVNVYNLGALEPELCEILRRNTEHVLTLSKVRTLNDSPPKEIIRRRKKREQSLEASCLQLLKRERQPVSVEQIGQELGISVSTVYTSCCAARKLLADDEQIVSVSMDGMRSYCYRKKAIS
jgi:DNA-binding NarL/FixJ family response regulator